VSLRKVSGPGPWGRKWEPAIWIERWGLESASMGRRRSPEAKLVKQKARGVSWGWPDGERVEVREGVWSLGVPVRKKHDSEKGGVGCGGDRKLYDSVNQGSETCIIFGGTGGESPEHGRARPGKGKGWKIRFGGRNGRKNLSPSTGKGVIERPSQW